MKQFSPLYLIKSAYNAAAAEVAREMVSTRHGEPFKGTAMSREANELVRRGEAVPTRERFGEIFADLCRRHGVAFEGGIDEFLNGAWEIQDMLRSS